MIGSAVVAISAIPVISWSPKIVLIVGLLLIAIGSGGIKPCVSAFGGDQFKLPEQTRQLATFFSLFYFTINTGSIISSSITPILKSKVYCFGQDDCYSLAFGVPAVLMLIAIGKICAFFSSNLEELPNFFQICLKKCDFPIDCSHFPIGQTVLHVCQGVFREYVGASGKMYLGR